MSKNVLHEQLVGLSRSLSEILRRKQFTIGDQSRLIEIGEEIRNAAESMTQCDGCDRVVESIVTITLEGETAKFCTQCGIRALREGRVILREEAPPSSERRSSSKAQKGKGKTTGKTNTRSTVRSQSQESGKPATDLHAEVEAASGLSKNEIKRLHKIIEGIALPMDVERTLAYVKAELKGDRKRIDDKKIEKAVPLLLAAF